MGDIRMDRGERGSVDLMVEDDLAVLTDRPGWTVAADVAVYEPVAGGWVGRVARLMYPAKAYDRFLVAIIDPAGNARYTMYASMVSEARRLAEGHVNGQQPAAGGLEH